MKIFTGSTFAVTIALSCLDLSAQPLMRDFIGVNVKPRSDTQCNNAVWHTSFMGFCISGGDSTDESARSHGVNWAQQAQPSAWLSEAKRVSLFAARYAAPPTGGFPAGFENIAGGYVESPDNSGLGLSAVRYIEIFNEMDALWNDNNVSPSVTGAALENDPNAETMYYHIPKQYAALLSAAYDGHQNSAAFEIKNGNNEVIGHWGIRNLSAGTEVVLAGTADMRYDYLYLLKKWWDENRGTGDYPFDVVNYHFYSTSGQPAIGSGTHWNQIYHGRDIFGGGNGIYPESPNVSLRARIEKLLFDRTQPSEQVHPSGNLPDLGPLFPDRPSWITEFGYDTEGPGSIKIVPFGSFDAQTIQGQWLTRYIMEASAAKGGGLTIDKVFMYELNDDLSVGGQFHHSGLVADDGLPKKSWYHLLTLKSVLDWTAFTKTNFDGNIAFLRNGQIMNPDDPRMYLYGDEEKPNYAIWVPHGEDLMYNGAILLKIDPNAPQTKPTIQAIEVVDYDEDGKRTEIHPDLIEPYFSQPGLPEPDYWKINGIRPGDTHITLKETPLYLRVNQTRVGSDKVVQPVKNLNASCLSCRDVKLTWEKQDPFYAFYNIYAQKIDCPLPSSSAAVFDPAKCVLVGDRITGVFTEATITGLDSAACYRFWVIPFAANGNAVGNQGILSLTTFSPTDMSAPQAGFHYFDYTVSNRAPCVASFSPTQISIQQNPFSPFEQEKFFEMLIPETGTDLCNELINAPNNYGIIIGNGNKVVFTIDFQGPKYADAIYFYYQSGNGRVRFEVLEDCCNLYSTVATIDIHDGANQPNSWYRIANTPINFKRIEKIRVTVEGLPEVGLNIKRMFFCLRPAEDECASVVMKEKDITPVTNIAVQDLDPYSAMLTWDAARIFEGEQELAPVEVYHVRYGIALDSEGEIVQPVELTYRAPAWGGENLLALTPLVPNTTYFVDILPHIGTYPCVRVYNEGRISFTTPSETQERSTRNKPAENIAEITLSPNPTDGLLQVSGLDERFQTYRVCQANGVFVREGRLTPGAKTTRIMLTDLPNGLYVITFLGSNVRPVAKAFVLNRG